MMIVWALSRMIETCPPCSHLGPRWWLGCSLTWWEGGGKKILSNSFHATAPINQWYKRLSLQGLFLVTNPSQARRSCSKLASWLATRGRRRTVSVAWIVKNTLDRFLNEKENILDYHVRKNKYWSDIQLHNEGSYLKCHGECGSLQVSLSSTHEHCIPVIEKK